MKYVKVGRGRFTDMLNKVKKLHDTVKNRQILSMGARILGFKDASEAAGHALQGYGYAPDSKTVMVGSGFWSSIKKAVGGVAKTAGRVVKGAVNAGHALANGVSNVTGLNPSTIAMMTGNPAAAGALAMTGHGAVQLAPPRAGRYVVLRGGPSTAGLAHQLV